MDWICETKHAAWEPRDSQAALVHDGKLWMLGGWTHSYVPALRDVWCSTDGKEWTCVQRKAPWKHGDLPMATVFNNRMWIMGGWYNGRLPGHSASHEVWSSPDGVAWDLATAQAGWSPRLAAGVATFQGRIWILGGIENYFFGTDAHLHNDVWASDDGETWECVLPRAPWSPRAYHQTVVFDGKLWVLGGGNYVPRHHALNDVWCSSDGIRWEHVLSEAPWKPRLWFRAAIYENLIWVLGGWNGAVDNFGDVWCSVDGAAWSPVETPTVWTPRHEHAAFVLQDKLWVAAGHARPLVNDVWSLSVPPHSGETPVRATEHT